MKTTNYQVIYDDYDVNIAGKKCIFHYTTSLPHYPLECLYGVSGAEMNSRDVYLECQHYYILGVYDNNMITNILTGKQIPIEKIQLQNVKLLDYGKLHQFFKNYIKGIDDIS